MYLFVGIGCYDGIGAQVLADDLPECACSCSVQDSQVFGVEHDCLVDKIDHPLQGFVSAHTPYVDVGFEFQPFLADIFPYIGINGGIPGLYQFFGLTCRHFFQLGQFRIGPEVSQSNNGVVPVDFYQFAYGFIGQANQIAFLQRFGEKRC